MVLQMKKSNLRHNRLILITVALIGSVTYAHADPDCYQTATNLWLERQISLVFESESQATKRERCIARLELQQTEQTQDIQYYEDRQGDEKFRKNQTSTPDPLANKELEASETGFQTISSKADENGQPSTSIPTLKGYRSINQRPSD